MMIKESNYPIFVEFQHVNKKYNDTTALKDVSFQIQKGEIFGYIGPNGAGKTTSMKILVGLIRDYTGEVFIAGKKVSENSLEVSKMLGYMPQDVGFQEWRTIDHALTSFGLLSGMTQQDLEVRIPEILELVGLADVRHKKIVHLSGGMQQKLRLAQALIHKPELLVLDEPMNGLDPLSRFQVKNIIKTLATQGMTIIFSSHILSDVQDIADHIGILNHGQIVRVKTPQQLQDEFQVGNAVEITVADNTKFPTKLDSLPSVEKVIENPPNKLVVRYNVTIDLNLAFNQLLKFLTEQQLAIRSVVYLRPSLEEVYIKFVGGQQE